MIWFYEHKGQFRRCELHPDNAHLYRLIIQDTDGTERVEAYEEYADVVRRTEQLASDWTRAGWGGPYSRDIR